MYPKNVDPEEMAMQYDLDLIASLNMIDEGAPAPLLEENKLENKEKIQNNPPKNN